MTQYNIIDYHYNVSYYVSIWKYFACASWYLHAKDRVGLLVRFGHQKRVFECLRKSLQQTQRLIDDQWHGDVRQVLSSIKEYSQSKIPTENGREK